MILKRKIQNGWLINISDMADMGGHADVIVKLPLFSGLSADELERLLRECGMHRKQIKSGENIIRLGSRVDELGVLLSGNARVVKDDFWGNSTILAHLHKGTYLARHLHVRVVLLRLMCMRTVMLLFCGSRMESLSEQIPAAQ